MDQKAKAESLIDIDAIVKGSQAKIDRMNENIKLATCIRDFTYKMTVKVASHVDDRSGWAEEENAVEMHESLVAALEDGDYVSVANYAMFLDNLGYKSGR